LNRNVLAALVAIALLTAGGVLFVLVAEREGLPAPTAPVTPDVPTPPTLETGVAAALPPRPASPAPAPTTAPTDSPERTSPAVEVRRRAQDFASMRREVVTGLRNLDPRVLACGLSSRRMMVTLESQDGHVRVLHATVPQPDTGDLPEGAGLPPARPGAMECAVRAVEGAVLDAPSAKPGRQWEMEYAPGELP
jgi:hypothetical protein